ncbi:DNA/RNA helicase [Cohnella endophytica]|uniref:DNA/RNA helicase n=1 Tax=Cohnella endophytica TaxID=2419778 RepID=A0A494XB58_9BACL|nr:helicase-related protein [Cohnella endophytica]RKP47262.1 DNA/RNA helicase [Cohnella endophytica]
MKVVLYAVRERKGWRARFSVAWEADAAYWGVKAARIVRVTETLPLGIAVRACDIWNERLVGIERGEWQEQRGQGQGQGGGLAQGLAEEFEKVVRTAWELAGEKREALQNARVETGERGVGLREREKVPLAGWIQVVSDLLMGRSLLREEAIELLASALPADCTIDSLALLQHAALAGALQLTAAVAPRPAPPPRHGLRGWISERLRAAPRRRRAQDLACRRCGSGKDKLRHTPCAACGRQACAYCEACLTMGRSRECGLLVIGVPRLAAQAMPIAAHQIPTKEMLSERWGLSPAQSAAASEALRFLAGQEGDAAAGIRQRESQSFLLWAVTGAGKTEMIFPLLDAVLSRGGKALVATPRRDVVLELAPRLVKAFPGRNHAVLYGGSPDRWANGALTLSTTHQLFRFQEAFDLVLIDELDAFPYHNDPMLHYAADKCRKQDGVTVLLSATPPPRLQREVARGTISCARVPVRYHRHPLPVPVRLASPSIAHLLRKQALPAKVVEALASSVRRGAQVFLFVPYVKQVDSFVQLVRSYADKLGIPAQAIAGTSSKDEERTGKVVDFRNSTTRLLITTTILERGVTIPRSDVFILDAHNPLFDASSLVQMAGRAGRSADDPFGFVYYGAPSWTDSQRNATLQIRAMNALARHKNYLLV